MRLKLHKISLHFPFVNLGNRHKILDLANKHPISRDIYEVDSKIIYQIFNYINEPFSFRYFKADFLITYAPMPFIIGL